MKQTTAILICSKTRENYKKILIGAINEQLKNLSLEQLIKIKHLIENNLVI